MMGHYFMSVARKFENDENGIIIKNLTIDSIIDI